jgi:hypothetical protein
MSIQQPETFRKTEHQRRSSGRAGGIVLVGWFLLLCSINTLSAAPVARSKGFSAAEVLLLLLVFPVFAVVPLAFALFRGERATRISAMLGLGFAVFIFYCIFQ